MAAQTARRPVALVAFSGKELPANAGTYYQGGLVGWDTATGRVMKGASSTTFLPIGTATEDTVIATNGDLLHVNLFREVIARWFKNLGADAVTLRGTLCYVEDDQTVRATDATNTRSVAGRVWDVSATRGVLVEPRTITDFRATMPGLDV